MSGSWITSGLNRSKGQHGLGKRSCCTIILLSHYGWKSTWDARKAVTVNDRSITFHPIPCRCGQADDELYIVMELLHSDLHRVIHSPQASGYNASLEEFFLLRLLLSCVTFFYEGGHTHLLLPLVIQPSKTGACEFFACLFASKTGIRTKDV